ncbi:phosphatase [Thiohalobacter thiocyanaticus]|uniref:Phosphatase n=1 Tax=Thiohalobacter thiocyanaticus TaxID=585455 RepID=A0A1Z4VTP7_9GAMM|nr:PhoX family phosphatase [Thiohalobacter thiocyanaticus]BAZ94772.1 phosphatase [Thiohalobacter thiocyanaticus]
MNDHDDNSSNNSGNRPFADILETRLHRRQVLKGGLAVAATGFFAGPAVAQAFGRDDRGRTPWQRNPRNRGLINFTPVAIADGSGPNPGISPDYQYDIILPWGDPLEPGGPAYSWPPTAADQALQLGIGHDGMWFFPMIHEHGRRFGWDEDRENNPWRGRALAFGQGNDHGVLCLNHEFGGNDHVLGKPVPESLEDVRASQHAHGVSVVEIRKGHGRDNRWQPVRSRLSRRIHVNTPVNFSGPAAGHPLLQTPNGNIPLGTVNNCANGYTPWGTYLTCEENFNGYFGTEDPAWTPNESQQRYGFLNTGFGYGWHLFDKRFDLADPDYRNEENRFGWIVEIDPFDPTRTPVKRTALGRTKHEGATVHVDDYGRVVVYSGDDQTFDYIYKFVSADNWRAMRARGESPLDHGTLYVARFGDDGNGEWLELSMNIPALAARFADMGELLVNTRIAADIVGATPMDRPEWVTVGADDKVYCALTNNSRRSVADGPNPLAPNPDGHIIRWSETSGFAGTTFVWDIFLIAEDTHADDREDTFSDPDGLWADPDGRLFIETDGGQKKGLNNQLLVADINSGELRRLFTGVSGCEVTGIAVTPDRRTLFVNIQHPGDGDPNQTNFPLLNAAPDGVTIPRDATVVITRRDGGIIGA